MSMEQQNRAFLAAYDPKLLDELDGLQETRALVEPARKQGSSMKFEGLWVHSKYDPLKEATKLTSGAPTSCHIHFGFGLGYFLEACELLPHTRTLIWEPRAELLLAALRHRDLKPLLEDRKVTLCCSYQRFKKLVPGVIQAGEEPRLIISPFHARAFEQDLSLFRQAAQEGNYSKNVGVRSMLKNMPLLTRSALRNLAAITSVPGVETLKDSFLNKPCVVVSPGPSLDKDLGELRRWADRVVIIAVTRTVMPLEKYGIQPHFLVHNEAQHYHSMLDHCTNLSETCLVLAEQAEAAFFARPSKKTFVFRNAGNQTGAWISESFPEIRRTALPSGGSVANDAFSFALHLGCNPIILCGQDLAIAGHSYYAASPFNFKFEHDEDSLRAVPGYFGGQVITLNNYLAFLLWFQDEAERLRKEDPARKLINTTGGGALIRGFMPMKLNHALACFAAPIIDLDHILEQVDRNTVTIDPKRLLALIDDGRSRIRGLIQLAKRSQSLEKSLRRKLASGDDGESLERLLGKLNQQRETYRQLNTGFSVLNGLLQAEFLEIKQASSKREAARPKNGSETLVYDCYTELEIWSQTAAVTASAARELDTLLEAVRADLPD